MTISALPETVSTDVAIIGAGPVGLFAVFECGMLGMKCRLIDALEEIGGQCAALYPEKPIFDIPALPEIAAGDLVRQLERQIAPFQAPVHLNQQVTTLDGSAGSFRLSTSAGTVIEAKAVMIAAGVGAFGPKRPPLDGIAHYETQGAGLGVQYMVRKIHDFAGKRVVIAGVATAPSIGRSSCPRLPQPFRSCIAAQNSGPWTRVSANYIHWPTAARSRW